VHRVGRTGRAGKGGITFITKNTEAEIHKRNEDGYQESETPSGQGRHRDQEEAGQDGDRKFNQLPAGAGVLRAVEGACGK
jgi:superfamily II DNA/RNA helicase